MRAKARLMSKFSAVVFGVFAIVSGLLPQSLWARDSIVEVGPIPSSPLELGTAFETAGEFRERALVELRFNGFSVAEDGLAPDMMARYLMITAEFGITEEAGGQKVLSFMNLDFAPYSSEFRHSEGLFEHTMRIDITPVEIRSDAEFGVEHAVNVPLVRMYQQVSAGRIGNSILGARFFGDVLGKLMGFGHTKMADGYSDWRTIGGIFSMNLGGALGAEIDAFDQALKLNLVFVGGEMDLSSADAFFQEVFSRAALIINDSAKVYAEAGTRIFAFNRKLTSRDDLLEYEYVRVGMSWSF